jgi:GNAT superfamily N-acetyltransferase
MNWYKKAQASNIVYDIREPSDLTAVEKQTLYNLTLGKSDEMYDTLKLYTQYAKEKYPGKKTDSRIIIAKDKNKIAGWALISEPKGVGNVIDVFIYVSKLYRRRGIGTTLSNMSKQYVLKMNMKPKAYPSYKIHDPISKSFYESIMGLEPYLEYRV